jgi:D-alanine-D-alanine ligase-like ATP-grasp enzyme
MSTLGLAYGAIDFRVDPGGQIYFLEVNPAGQFLYLQARVDIPIVEALAALLARAASS